MCWPSLPEGVKRFGALCERERAPYAVIGETNGSGRLVVTDRQNGTEPDRRAPGYDSR